MIRQFLKAYYSGIIMAAPAEEETPTTIEETVQFDFNLDIFNNDDGQTDNNLDEFDLELDDQMLLDFVENYESELSIMLESASQHPTRDPTPTSTGQEPDMPPQAYELFPTIQHPNQHICAAIAKVVNWSHFSLITKLSCWPRRFTPKD